MICLYDLVPFNVIKQLSQEMEGVLQLKLVSWLHLLSQSKHKSLSKPGIQGTDNTEREIWSIGQGHDVYMFVLCFADIACFFCRTMKLLRRSMKIWWRSHTCFFVHMFFVLEYFCVQETANLKTAVQQVSCNAKWFDLFSREIESNFYVFW